MSLSAELKKKIARVKLKETGTFVSIYAGDLIYDILRVDPRVVDGVDFLRKDDLSSVLKFGKQEIADRAEKSKESAAEAGRAYKTASKDLDDLTKIAVSFKLSVYKILKQEIAKILN